MRQSLCTRLRTKVWPELLVNPTSTKCPTATPHRTRLVQNTDMKLHCNDAKVDITSCIESSSTNKTGACRTVAHFSFWGRGKIITRWWFSSTWAPFLWFYFVEPLGLLVWRADDVIVTVIRCRSSGYVRWKWNLTRRQVSGSLYKIRNKKSFFRTFSCHSRYDVGNSKKK